MLTFFVRFVYMKTGSLDHFIKVGFDYNHVLNLLAAFGLFQAFLHWEISGESMIGKAICKWAPYSFGVYLCHEQIEMRYLWPKWIGATGEGNVLVMVVRCIGSVLLVYAIGSVIDMMRTHIFKGIRKVIHKIVK